MKNRVLIISTAYLPLVGGAELAIKEITERLKGYKFDLVCARLRPNLASFEKIGNINLRRVGFGLGLDKYLLPIFVLLKGIFGTSYGLIWAVMVSYGTFSLPIIKIVHPKTRFLLTLQEGDSEEHILRRVGIFYPLWKLVFKRADYIQTISTYLKDFAIRHGARCPIGIVPNGVDVKKFQIPKSKYQINSKIQNPKVQTIITISRLVPKNGIDTLIKSTKELKSLIPNSKFLIQIVGSGPDENKLKKLTKDLGVDNVVEFVGEVNPDNIPKYLASADIFVRPSRSEGLGNSFLEAMAAGLPIIGTPVGGIVDFLKDGETGLFSKVDDPKSLAEKIQLLLTDREFRNRIATNGQKLVIDKYSWDNVAQKMNNIFKKLCVS